MCCCVFFCYYDASATEIFTLSLLDALPISVDRISFSCFLYQSVCVCLLGLYRPFKGRSCSVPSFCRPSVLLCRLGFPLSSCISLPLATLHPSTPPLLSSSNSSLFPPPPIALMVMQTLLHYNGDRRQGQQHCCTSHTHTHTRHTHTYIHTCSTTHPRHCETVYIREREGEKKERV